MLATERRSEHKSGPEEFKERREDERRGGMAVRLCGRPAELNAECRMQNAECTQLDGRMRGRDVTGHQQNVDLLTEASLSKGN